ncbi:MAG: 50S ribosome-binding GTPase, partial [Spirochaetaceae bacterium]|nr:50S ribosome-binding GTPase [Spirochaetaceae bacterium]
LGVLTLDDRDIIIADIPGLIEGASEGLGLGIRFLKHISRTAALAFLIDLSADTWEGAYGVLYKELDAFSPELVRKPRVILGTKTDLPGTGERLDRLKARFPGEQVRGISVFSGEGIPELARVLLGLADSPRKALSGDEAVPEPGEVCYR